MINTFDQLIEEAKKVSEKHEHPVRIVITAGNDRAALEAIQDAKTMKIADGLLPGDVFIAELDFPILVQSIFIQVGVRWIRLIKGEKLLQIGVRFCKSDKAFRGVIKNLIKYIDHIINFTGHICFHLIFLFPLSCQIQCPNQFAQWILMYV